jgi:hypothetical protein
MNWFRIISQLKFESQFLVKMLNRAQFIFQQGHILRIQFPL